LFAQVRVGPDQGRRVIRPYLPYPYDVTGPERDKLRLARYGHGQSLHSVLNGAIRFGRDLETRQRILRDLSQMWTRLTGQPEEELLISLWENLAENVIEAGSIFPALGQERQ